MNLQKPSLDSSLSKFMAAANSSSEEAPQIFRELAADHGNDKEPLAARLAFTLNVHAKPGDKLTDKMPDKLRKARDAMVESGVSLVL
jgi:hypothetical protein